MEKSIPIECKSKKESKRKKKVKRMIDTRKKRKRIGDKKIKDRKEK